MNFNMELIVGAQPEEIWPLFFDVARVATLIPGCEEVEEKEPLSLYQAVMKQKVGPFRIEAPCEVSVEELVAPSLVRARIQGRDKRTGTTVDMQLCVTLATTDDSDTRLVVDSTMQVAGRLASLGYPVVKRKVKELFVQFEQRLRAELGLVDEPAQVERQEGGINAAGAI